MAYVLMLLFALKMLGATLTLPGIAGIILSVGIAVDANVLIFEHFKEEMRSGKTIRSSMNAGFKRAFVTILDSHLTSILSSTVLFFFGTGPIKGFAITLGLGAILSLFTAITMTQYQMRWLIGSDIIHNERLFGASLLNLKKAVKENE